MAVLETIELQAGERAILTLQIPKNHVIIFDPVTHAAHVIDVTGELGREREELSIVFSTANVDSRPVGDAPWACPPVDRQPD